MASWLNPGVIGFRSRKYFSLQPNAVAAEKDSHFSLMLIVYIGRLFPLTAPEPG